MDAPTQTPASLVHFYDTRTHAIACGAEGPDRRSTKHPRQVTCQSCVALSGASRALDDGAGAIS
ncbi:hypothetical protein [Anaeromyxobacter sp. PSR-1]|uniref:hypothetical protein n=1 Tax=unclassified Anaeromyxobacter TaxID=2620896 RepID=UPI0005DE97C2|nr:hypothetical protein [Anaeromyxobacter sp. PSR-1]GAO04736.1 hypothetical protein PSR1_03632 [Anaeromyxobacter sp. PSR-1]